MAYGGKRLVRGRGVNNSPSTFSGPKMLPNETFAQFKTRTQGQSQSPLQREIAQAAAISKSSSGPAETFAKLAHAKVGNNAEAALHLRDTRAAQGHSTSEKPHGSGDNRARDDHGRYM